MIYTAVSLSIGQLTDPRFRSVLFLGVLLAVAVLGAITLGMVTFVAWLFSDPVTLPFMGSVEFVSQVLSWATALLFAILSSFLMMPVASAIMPLFLDRVADAVEDMHYPNLAPASTSSIGDAIRDGVNFLGVLIAANLAALVLYLIFAPAAPFIFWALNGYLLGREYFMLAALRRMPRPEAKALRARHSGVIWAAGTVIAVPLSVPVINLIVPILGVAALTHLFHLTQGRNPSDRTNPNLVR